MAGPRSPKSLISNLRPLLNLGGGDKPGLQKVLQALMGVRPAKAAPPVPAPAPAVPVAEPQADQTLAILHSLGFEPAGPGQTPVLLTHHLAPERQVAYQPPTGTAHDPESVALDWAARHFPEMEFYLPYISRRAARTRRPTGRPTTPEPEYDEDGFLADYP
jgi:hypothetical protein